MSLYEFKLPDVGEGLSEGEIVRWLVAEGEVVAVDQLIVEVQTDKAIVEIPAPVAGVIRHLGGQVNDIVPVGATLVSIEVSDGASAEASAEASEGVTPTASPPPAQASGRADGAVSQRRSRASPATRKLARELGVDLAQVPPGGSRGQVTRADVEAAAQRSAEPASAGPATGPERGSAEAVGDTGAAPGPAGAATGRAVATATRAPVSALSARSEPLRGLRRTIARAMDEAWRSVPHIFSMDDLDASGLLAARRALNDDLADEGIKLSFLPFFIKACAAALQAHPRFNASIDLAAERIDYHEHINIGIATQTPDGLIVTVLRDAERKSVVALGREVAELAELARQRRVGLQHLSGATFSISNYGSYGAHMGTPIIRPPEVAIAGFGRIADAVVPVDGVPAVRPRLPFCLSADHRLNDGEDLGRFTATMSRYLLEPVRLLALD